MKSLACVTYTRVWRKMREPKSFPITTLLLRTTPFSAREKPLLLAANTHKELSGGISVAFFFSLSFGSRNIGYNQEKGKEAVRQVVPSSWVGCPQRPAWAISHARAGALAAVRDRWRRSCNLIVHTSFTPFFPLTFQFADKKKKNQRATQMAVASLLSFDYIGWAEKRGQQLPVDTNTHTQERDRRGKANGIESTNESMRLCGFPPSLAPV